MQMRMRLAQLGHQANIALHHARLCFGRHAAQSQPERHRAKIHARTLRHAGVFGVLDYGESYARRCGEGLAHHAVFEDGPPIVGDGYCCAI